MRYYDVKGNKLAAYWKEQYTALLKQYQTQLVKEVLKQEQIDELYTKLWKTEKELLTYTRYNVD